MSHSPAVQKAFRKYSRERDRLEAEPEQPKETSMSGLPDGLELWGLWKQGEWYMCGEKTLLGNQILCEYYQQDHPPLDGWQVRRYFPPEPEEPTPAKDVFQQRQQRMPLITEHTEMLEKIARRLEDGFCSSPHFPRQQAKEIRAFLDHTEPEPQHPLLAAIDELSRFLENSPHIHIVQRFRSFAEPFAKQAGEHEKLVAQHAEMRAMLEKAEDDLGETGYDQCISRANEIRELLARTEGT